MMNTTNSIINDVNRNDSSTSIATYASPVGAIGVCGGFVTGAVATWHFLGEYFHTHAHHNDIISWCFMFPAGILCGAVAGAIVGGISGGAIGSKYIFEYENKTVSNNDLDRANISLGEINNLIDSKVDAKFNEFLQTYNNKPIDLIDNDLNINNISIANGFDLMS